MKISQVSFWEIQMLSISQTGALGIGGSLTNRLCKGEVGLCSRDPALPVQWAEPVPQTRTLLPDKKVEFRLIPTMPLPQHLIIELDKEKASNC